MEIKDFQDALAAGVEKEVDGFILTNTTLSRKIGFDDFEKSHPAGGLSGRPLLGRSNHRLRQAFRFLKGEYAKRGEGDRIPFIVGVGGVFTPEDALSKIKSGASLVQVYTGFVYGGPATVANLHVGLQGLLKHEGFSNWSEAVGIDAHS